MTERREGEQIVPRDRETGDERELCAGDLESHSRQVRACYRARKIR